MCCPFWMLHFEVIGYTIIHDKNRGPSGERSRRDHDKNRGATGQRSRGGLEAVLESVA